MGPCFPAHPFLNLDAVSCKMQHTYVRVHRGIKISYYFLKFRKSSTRYLKTGIVLKKLPGPINGIGLKPTFSSFRNAIFQIFFVLAF